ncbi:MAG TPA: GatB/YqeY domain-containing protein [Candidatus Saccharimonadales bacterium]|jgi:uncharacterized protein YqeY|nr:GatB/YqeY domain-containing protein [Candidatus Saccharimonadales bacterium]
MTISERLEQDIKTALLSGNSKDVSTLRGLKSAILYAEVAKGVKDAGLSETDTQDVLSKEAKKRQESADLYNQGGEAHRAEEELQEKALIEKYLPPKLSDDQLSKVVNEAIAEVGAKDASSIGPVISLVKQKTQGAADNALVAQKVKESLGL